METVGNRSGTAAPPSRGDGRRVEPARAVRAHDGAAAHHAALSAVLRGLAGRLAALDDGRPPPALDPRGSPALLDLRRIFGLDDAALELLCLAAGQEIDAGLRGAIALVCGVEDATVALAERLHGPSAFGTLCESGRLRRWRLVDLAGGGPLSARRIVVDGRILAFLLGEDAPDARLDGLVRVVRAGSAAGEDALSRPTRDLAAVLARAGPPPFVHLAGADPTARREVAVAAADRLGRAVLGLRADDLPGDWTQRHALAVLLDRELALSGAVALFECDEGDAGRAARLAEAMTGPVVASAAEALRVERSPCARIELPPLDAAARRAIWRRALGDDHPAADPAVARLAARFALDHGAIRAVAAEAAAHGPADAAALWQAARRRARGPLDGLAQRIAPRAGWDDLVLPPEQVETLRDLLDHLTHAFTVDEDWGWAAKGGRGLGAAALFSGASGTGKTLAAEIVAAGLALDLYRIDLSQVVSKYIGETEKNLARIFAAAESGGAILLFDEADALFGKRSEVKDSHDRYANVEVSYLLQEMEAYRGLAVLTTNQRQAIDKAFLRRLDYVVDFPFPDAGARAAIWARVFPPETPTAELEPARLARLAIPGGAIRSIARNAAFLAAARGGPVGPEHVLRAARREYAKLEKPFTEAEMEAFR